ncbi:class I SAM-dependent methyltransferase [Amycolatopsis sp. CA-230715]|uniref:class I SAM-dependent methyltransferase n=1 Tax=Amycolatopsis sp. CA-230715 TaxID=2745196 RepID=UPI001C013ABD|nr:class I SAM-dependent methyltransferase [Amycolatopsis sp. CA-230715]QWF83626.1 Ubiquinone/menaquinone biosynthesis C-methyltransferase UbiE [Amycolatopsis sp. CA-230715]
MDQHNIGRFDRQAAGYDRAFLQAFFGPVQRAVLDSAAAVVPEPKRLLDVGAGTGQLLAAARELFPDTEAVGVEPAEAMLAKARDKGLPVERGVAERLPFEDGRFDVVVSTMSFHHWADQRAGLREVARVLAPGGVAVIAEHFAQTWLRPVFAMLPKRNRAPGHREVDAMIAEAGLLAPRWETVFHLDPFLLFRDAGGRRARGTLPFVTAVAAAKRA